MALVAKLSLAHTVIMLMAIRMTSVVILTAASGINNDCCGYYDP